MRGWAESRLRLPNRNRCECAWVARSATAVPIQNEHVDFEGSCFAVKPFQVGDRAEFTGNLDFRIRKNVPRVQTDGHKRNHLTGQLHIRLGHLRGNRRGQDVLACNRGLSESCADEQQKHENDAKKSHFILSKPAPVPGMASLLFRIYYTPFHLFCQAKWVMCTHIWRVLA